MSAGGDLLAAEGDMMVLAPDILELTRDLSPMVSGAFIVFGLLLWLYGAYSHRFWLAVGFTVLGGVVGLMLGREFSVQPLVAGLLLALSAGFLSLALSRVTLFAVSGFSTVLLARRVGVEWSEIISFLIGGLLGVSLYRLWITLVSSALGTVFMAYGAVSLLTRLNRLDGVDWAARNGPLINWGLFFTALLGVVVQTIMDRRRAKAVSAKADEPKKEEKKEEPAAAAPPASLPLPAYPPAPPPPPPPPPPPEPWWKKSLQAARSFWEKKAA